jgi:diacylglycerol O-acyltransferase
MPFDLSDPVWVEDDDFDLDYHVRHITLPKPGTNRQLQQYVARLHSSLLDRSRPLWEFFVIDGLKSGEVALYTKAHHAGIDGQAGIAVAQAIFDTAPTGRVVRPPRARIKRSSHQLGLAELAGAAVRHTAVQYAKLARMAPGMVRAVREAFARPQDDGPATAPPSLASRLDLFAPARRSTSASPTSGHSPDAPSRWPRSSRSPMRWACRSTMWCWQPPGEPSTVSCANSVKSRPSHWSPPSRSACATPATPPATIRSAW